MLRSLPDAIYLEKVCDLRSAEELCDLLSTASIRTMLRSSLLGFVAGVLPGATLLIAPPGRRSIV